MLQRSLLAIGLLSVLACDSGPPTRSSQAEAEPAGAYNVVLISIDTLRADHLSAYGYERETTPAMDALAAERGVLFERAYSQAPVTAPSHMTILTGLLPDAHGTWNLETPEFHALPEGIPTLASLLADRGYRTFAATDGGNVSGDLGFRRGFETYEEPLAGHLGGAAEVFRRGAEKVEEWRNERFFLFLHTYQTHDPYTPPRSFRDLYADPDYGGGIVGDSEVLHELSGGELDRWHQLFWDRVDRESPADRQHLIDLYDACIRYTDTMLGEFVQTLDAAGLRDETVIVILSDHGEEFQDHGGYLHYSVYQENLHVPLVLLLPQRELEGQTARRRTDLARLVDVTPSILDLLKLPAPRPLAGRSLFSKDAADAERPVFSLWPREHLAGLRVGNWKLIHGAAGPESVLHRRKRTALFDLASDPEETRDLARQQPRKRDELLRQLAAIRADARASRAGFEDGETRSLSDEKKAELRALGYLRGE